MTDPVGRAQITCQGNEQQTVVIIDDFVSDPAEMVDEAASLNYSRIGPYYPGIRAVVPDSRMARLLPDILPLIQDIFGLKTEPRLLEAFYSLATTAPEKLLPIQRLPHFDGLDDGRIAVLQYLFREEYGGTSFYRHRSTGYESVNEERWPNFARILEEEVARTGLPPPAYIAGDTPLYQKIASYDARYNRTIIYRGNTLHCGNISNILPLSALPHQGRLTLNCFLLADATF